MARSEARLSVTIWDDSDFLALGPTAQRMFMFLISQRDLAHTGVLALRERRWSKGAAGLTVADVTRDLDELARARFVVIDEDAEELLIRSFLRRDKVYRQPNVLRAAADHLPAVTSPKVLAALAAELRRVLRADDISNDCAGIVRTMLEGIGNPSPNPSGMGPADASEGATGHLTNVDAFHDADACSPVIREDALTPTDSDDTETSDVKTHGQILIFPGDKGSGNPSGNPSRKGTRGAPGDRGVVTAASEAAPNPDPRSTNPVPQSTASRSTSRAGARTPASAHTREAADAAFATFWATYPRRTAKRDARKAWDKALTRSDAATITAAAARYRDEPGRDSRYTPHPATWLNGDRWEDERRPPRADRPGTREYDGMQLNERTIADLERDKRFAAMENGATHSAIEGHAS